MDSLARNLKVSFNIKRNFYFESNQNPLKKKKKVVCVAKQNLTFVGYFSTVIMDSMFSACFRNLTNLPLKGERKTTTLTHSSILSFCFLKCRSGRAFVVLYFSDFLF
jgi:hypothetical protein